MKKSLDKIYSDVKTEKIHMSDIVDILFESCDLDNNKKIELYKEFIPRIIDYIDGNTLLDYIYDIDEMNDYVMYLFHKNKVNLYKVPNYIYKHILKHTYWGLDFILRNIDEISDGRIFNMISWCENNEKLYEIFAKAFKNNSNKLHFIEKCIDVALWGFDENTIISSIYENGLSNYEQLNFFGNSKNNKLVKNNLGHLMMKLDFYKDIIDKYGQELFESENVCKIKFLGCLGENYNYLKKKYEIALLLYSASYGSNRTDAALSHSINYGKYDEFDSEIRNISNSLNFSIVSLGTNKSDIFEIKNNIIKVGEPRYNNNIDRDFFRIIPGNIIYVKDENNKIVAVFEFQKKLRRENITPEMIYDLFLDFKKHGKYISDPRCLLFDADNFGFLDSYEDASLGSFKKHSDLPDNFKKNPLVLFDVDLVYEYGSNNKPPADLCFSFTMDDAIRNYEKIKKYKKE